MYTLLVHGGCVYSLPARHSHKLVLPHTKRFSFLQHLSFVLEQHEACMCVAGCLHPVGLCMPAHIVNKAATQPSTNRNAGPRDSIVSVLPHQDSVVAWRVVAYSSGYQPLPQIELTSRQHSVLLNATHERSVHVLPSTVSLPGQSSGAVFTSGVDSLTSSMSRLVTGPPLVLT